MAMNESQYPGDIPAEEQTSEPTETELQLSKEELPHDNMTEIGYLTISAGTGGKAYPLTNVQAEIYLPDETGEYVLYRRTNTGNTGTAERIPIPTPRLTLSQEPDSAYQPYTVARVRAYRTGYYSVEAKEVPVFSGITSLQYFNMIPVSEGDAYGDLSDDIIITSEDTENAL